MGDYGLAALSGILKGFEGFPKGLAEQEKTDLTSRVLAESARHNQATENQAYLDLPPEVASQLGLPSGRIRKELAPLFEKMTEKKTAREETRRRGENLAQALEPLATSQRDTTSAEPEALGMPTIASQPESVDDPRVRALQGALRAGAFGDAPAEKLFELVPGLKAPQAASNITEAGNRRLLVTHDKAGNIVNQVDIGPHMPNSAQVDVQRRRLEAEYRQGQFKFPPGSDQFDIELGNRLESVIPLAPGGSGIRKSNVPNAASVPGGQPSISRPALSSEGTVERVAQARYSVNEMSTLADELRALSPDNVTRISQAWRSEAQGIPFLNAIRFLEPAEQDIATRLRHAQIRYEQAVSGLRGAGSPQMYDRFRKIVGDFSNATTPEALEGLAHSMNDYIKILQTAEVTSGKQGFPGMVGELPPRRAAQPAAKPEADWVDIGGGIKVRRKR